MANFKYTDRASNKRAEISISGDLLIDASNEPTVSGVYGLTTASRVTTGHIRLTLEDTYSSLLDCSVTPVAGAVGGEMGGFLIADEVDASTPYVDIGTTVSGVATDLTSTTVKIVLDLCQDGE